jgi:hypothetical protein
MMILTACREMARMPMRGELEGDNGGSSFCSSLFRCIPAPILPQHASPTLRAGKLPTRSRRKPVVSTRSSTRLAARPSSVPVTQRAQQKLMRELDFINVQTPAPDAAVTTYVDLYAPSRRSGRRPDWEPRKFPEPWQRWQQKLELQRWRFHEYAATDAEKRHNFSTNVPPCSVVCG